MQRRTFLKMAGIRLVGICLMLLCSVTVVIGAGEVGSKPGYTSVRPGSNPCLLLDGEPYFPFGYYNFSFCPKQVYLDTNVKLQSDGFNSCKTWNVRGSRSGEMTIADFLECVDDAAVKNIKYMAVPCGDPGDDWELVRQGKNKPAILAWNVTDDACGQPVGKVRNDCAAVKSIDPNHVTHISLNKSPDKSRNYDKRLEACDMASNQLYPIRDGKREGNLFEDFIRGSAHVDRCLAKGKIPTADLQSFHWYSANARMPTGPETDVMTYFAIIAGVKGIAYYKIQDEDYTNSFQAIDVDHPEVYAAIKTCASEILGSLKDPLLNGVLTRTNLGNYCAAGQWVYNSNVYVIVANGSRSSANLSVPLVSGAGTDAIKLFSHRDGGMTVSGGKLTGSVGSMKVHIYTLPYSPQGR